MAKYLIGSDPELFVVGGNGEFISGHHFPCGTKDNPRKTPNGAVQVDGIALEFNTVPSSDKEGFIKNFKAVLSDLNTIVEEIHPGASLKAIPTAEVGFKFLDEVPEMNRELGCNPDFNAYTMAPNESPDSSNPFRTGSGHVHIGFCEPNDMNANDFFHFMKCCQIAKELDFYLGLPSLHWDSDNRRRELYGKAGAFRPKPYGMEYRVLSNAWVNEDKLMGFVFDQTQKAMENFDKGILLHNEFGDFAEQMIATANANWHEVNTAVYARVM